MEELQINELPVELLAKVLGNLRRTNDRNRAMKVCSLWESIIDETLGVRQWIGNGSDFWEPNSSRWRPLMEIHRGGISHVCFSDVMDSLRNFRNPHEITFLRPNLVEDVEFDGFMTQEIYENLMRPLMHLKTLSLHISTSSYVALNLCDKSFPQTLTKLAITSEGFLRTHLREYDLNRVYSNFTSILRTDFPCLKAFDSCLPIFLDKEIEIYALMTRFLHKHSKTLQKLYLKWNFRWHVRYQSTRHRTLEEIDEVNAQVEEHYNSNSIQKVDPKEMNLKALVFVIEDRGCVFPTALGVKDLILSQTNLEIVFFLCWHYIDVPVDWLKSYGAKLKEIGLTINDITNPLDCSVLSGCKSLQKLTLEADGQAQFDDLALAPRLQNPQNLPLSLTSLTFRNVYIVIHDVELIVKSQKNLQTLVLVNIGKVENLGMSVPCLLWLLKESPTLKKLKVKGLNDLCFHTDFPMDDDDANRTCPFCDPPNILEGDGDHELPPKPKQRLSTEDRELLEELLEETNMDTKYVPLLKKKSNGSWKKIATIND